MEFDPSHKKHASVYAKDSFICVKSCAGYRRCSDEGLVAFLPGSAAAEAVGNAVVAALDSYRLLSEGEIGEFFAVAKVEERNRIWEAELMRCTGYRSVKEMYSGLKHVPVRLERAEVTVRSTKKDRRNGWEAVRSAFSVNANLGPVAIGEAVKRALGESA
jgi:hypothetical protein